MTNIGKEITKLNNKLDQVLEKLVEFEDISEQKKEAVSAIEADDFSKALELVKNLEKEHLKHVSLVEQEKEIRGQLEALRSEAEQAAKGEFKEPNGPS